MNCKSRTPTFLYMIVAAAVLSMGPNVMALEEPGYDVLETEGNFELRRYESFIVAETDVEGDFDKVGSDGFRRLADYIGGKNKKKRSISMTAPVAQRPESEKIAMTAPVTQKRENQRWRITFMMPCSMLFTSKRPSMDGVFRPPAALSLL